jgi:hypothetical protein
LIDRSSIILREEFAMQGIESRSRFTTDEFLSRPLMLTRSSSQAIFVATGPPPLAKLGAEDSRLKRRFLSDFTVETGFGKER